MLVNGIEPAWAAAVFTVLGVPVNGISEIEYSDTQEKTNNWGAGAKPVSRSYGKYEAKGSITLHSSEVERLTAASPTKDLTDLGVFDITVTIAPTAGNLPVRHKLRGCEFTGNSRTMKQGDAKFDVKLELIVSEIEWS